MNIKYLVISFIILIVGVYVFVMTPVPNDLEPASSGEVSIGGDFVLTDQNDEIFGSQSLKGKWRLVYFGFTHCPHVCPTDVAHISRAVDILDTEKVVPIFISVDPKRDTPEQLTSYFSNFNDSFIALTGTVEQIKAVEQDFKVFSQEVEDESMNEYTMNHSAYTYLMGPNGKYVTHFPHDTSGEEMAKLVKEHVVF